MEFAVGSPLDSQFLHRTNRDGTFDSVCRECFITVASVNCEADLDKAEKDHVLQSLDALALHAQR